MKGKMIGFLISVSICGLLIYEYVVLYLTALALLIFIDVIFPIMKKFLSLMGLIEDIIDISDGKENNVQLPDFEIKQHKKVSPKDIYSGIKIGILSGIPLLFVWAKLYNT